MALISVREYGKLFIGEFDSTRPSIHSSHAELLTNLKPIYGFEPFKYVNGKTISAQQYVGVFQFGEHTIEVLPKIDVGAPMVRRNLVAMLAVALDIDISEGDIARVDTQNHGILEILIRLFCDKLFVQVHRGLVKRYEGREENLSVLRGKLAVVEQVRLNAANPERLFCRFDEFHEDNPLNQVLKAAIRFLLKFSRELRNIRQLSELLLMFEGASDCPVATLPWHRVAFDRLSERYKPCFKLGELFLKQTPPDVSGGSLRGISLFFDMNVLFEEYIGRMAVRTFSQNGYRIMLQRPQRHLAHDEKTGSGVFNMKPDVVCALGPNVEWILDTKWKQLSIDESKDGVSQADLYQMYAYASCYNCPDVVLLYPYHKEIGGNAGIRGRYLLNPWLEEVGNRRTKLVRIATIDLADLRTASRQLKKIFMNEVPTSQEEIATL